MNGQKPRKETLGLIYKFQHNTASTISHHILFYIPKLYSDMEGKIEENKEILTDGIGALGVILEAW